jgi:hypothetical protein
MTNCSALFLQIHPTNKQIFAYFVSVLFISNTVNVNILSRNGLPFYFIYSLSSSLLISYCFIDKYPGGSVEFGPLLSVQLWDLEFGPLLDSLRDYVDVSSWHGSSGCFDTKYCVYYFHKKWRISILDRSIYRRKKYSFLSLIR